VTAASARRTSATRSSNSTRVRFSISTQKVRPWRWPAVARPRPRANPIDALPVDHEYANAPLTHLSQLAGENFVSCPKYEDPGYREIVEAICLRAGFMPRVLQAVEHKSTVLDLVANGLGITFVQRSAATERPDGIRYVQFPGCIPHVDSAIAWRADARHESIAPFAEAAEQEATQLPGQLRAVSDAAVSCRAG
jgi:DNA-binding transcriptional LysR family regulator